MENIIEQMRMRSETIGDIPRRNYDGWDLSAREFMESIDNKDGIGAYHQVKENPQLTFALPILYIKEAYWRITEDLDHERGEEFLESCERALNGGERDKFLRQLILTRHDSWTSGIHDGRFTK